MESDLDLLRRAGQSHRAGTCTTRDFHFLIALVEYRSRELVTTTDIATAAGLDLTDVDRIVEAAARERGEDSFEPVGP